MYENVTLLNFIYVCLFYLCIDFCLLFCSEALMQLQCFLFFWGGVGQSCDDVPLFENTTPLIVCLGYVILLQKEHT